MEIKTEEKQNEGQFLEILQYGGGPDESYLRGTSSALKRLGEELIRVSEGRVDEDPDIFDLFDDSDISIDYIEVVKEGGKPIQSTGTPSTLWEKISISVLSILFFGSLFIGFGTILRYIGKIFN